MGEDQDGLPLWGVELPRRRAYATLPAVTRLNVYSGAGLDRADHLRGDEGAMGRILRDPATRFVAVWRSHNLVAANGAEGPRVS